MFLILLATFGLTAILIEGKPTAPIRAFIARLGTWGEDLVRCYLCLGFWCALGLSLWRYWGDWPRVILLAFAGSGVSWALGSWVRSQTSIVPFFKDQEEGDE